MATHFDSVVVNASKVVTCDGTTTLLGEIPRGAIGIQNGKVAWIGTEDAIPEICMKPGTQRIDAKNGLVTPGLVDPHTHLVFAGERSKEFELRCAGASYLEIAAAGGGIANTVSATRAASEDELLELALPRLRQLLEQGVTTVEIKSGYGLSVEHELKMLRVIQKLRQRQPVKIVATLLCLHSVPAEHKNSRQDYLEKCSDELLPEVARLKLADFCDAFVEQSAFAIEEVRPFLEKSRSLGLKLRAHVDQLTSGGGAEFAAEMGCSSADHLEQVSAAGIQALAKAKVVAVLAPTSTLFAKAEPFASGRKLIDSGVITALCTNLNPGSSMSANVTLSMGLACLKNGLSPSEAFLGFTRNAGTALKEDAGLLRVGAPADLCIFRCQEVREIPYHFGMNQIRTVLVGGSVVVSPD